MDTSSNQPGGQPPQQSSYTPPPPPPPPQKKGFNWLACCGITCLVLVIIGALMAWGCYRMAQPFIGLGIEMAKVQESVSATDITTIRSSATEVSTDAVKETPTVFEDQWIAVEGVISSGYGSPGAFSTGEFSTEDTTQYVLEGNIFVLDISQAPSVGSAGDTIRAYGKIISWDMSEMGNIPFVGQALQEEMQKDPQFAESMQMIFVIAKEVELVTADSGDSGEAAPEESAEESEGWVN